MSTLVIGYGSIGKRHARVLRDNSHKVSVVSRREVDFKPSYRSIEDAFKNEKFSTVIIASKTNEHVSSISTLRQLGFAGSFLVEKPLAHNKKAIDDIDSHEIYVAYNLRFHPILSKLKTLLEEEDIISLEAYAGKYLPGWRPDSDYRESYSAKKSEGGGVLRDLSHELDYILWITGDWKRVSAIGGKWSDLEIDSDESYSILMQTEKCPSVTIHLNYLDRPGHRYIRVHTNKKTIEADLFENFLKIDEEKEDFEIDRDLTYKLEHQAIMDREKNPLCTFEESVNVIELIEAIEDSNIKQKWVVK